MQDCPSLFHYLLSAARSTLPRDEVEVPFEATSRQAHGMARRTLGTSKSKADVAKPNCRPSTSLSALAPTTPSDKGDEAIRPTPGQLTPSRHHAHLRRHFLRSQDLSRQGTTVFRGTMSMFLEMGHRGGAPKESGQRDIPECSEHPRAQLDVGKR